MPDLSPWGQQAIAAWQLCFGLMVMSPAGGVLGFRWADVAAKLRPLGMWTADVVRGLDVVERVMVTRFRPGGDSFEEQAEELLESD